MNGREAVGYVVEIDHGEVVLNLLDVHRGQLAAHSQGVSQVTEIGTLLALNAGAKLLIMRVQSISFAEPKEAHKVGIARNQLQVEPLRHVKGIIVGFLTREGGKLCFTYDSLTTPTLGSEAFPLVMDEYGAISGQSANHKIPIVLGNNLRGYGPVVVNLSDLISRHIAVLGSSGNGKTSFGCTVLQQIVNLNNSHIVIFDMNGEYEQALRPHLNEDELLVTQIGGGGYRIPYYALGRQGLHRLLLPSEKTQKPALTFAIDALNRVQTFTPIQGVGLVGDHEPRLFDDCRQEGAAIAQVAIESLRDRSAAVAPRWPHMSALSALVAESYAIGPNNRNNLERNGFNYGNVAPLVYRIRRLVEDERFSDIVDITGGPPPGRELDLSNESQRLVERIFGSRESTWKVHIVNLRLIAQDLMPMVLGSLLELYASELFKRGQGNSPDTLLVLEEAHHYLRSIGVGEEAKENALAYERLAKEGRKFGLALWISTQRPSEVSPTVLSQCGTWVCFRLTTEQDLSAVANATEWVDKRDVRRISGLAKRNAIAFGSGVIMPTLFSSRDAVPPPKSEDPAFDLWDVEPQL